MTAELNDGFAGVAPGRAHDDGQDIINRFVRAVGMDNRATAKLVTRRGRKPAATSKDPFGHRLGVGAGKPDDGQRTCSRGRGQRRYHIQRGHPVFTRAARALFSRFIWYCWATENRLVTVQ